MSIDLGRFFQSKMISSSTTIREMIEAARGDRVARIEVSSYDLARVLKWASQTDYAVTYGSYYVPLIDPGMETWSTSCVSTTHLDKNTCISIFLGLKQNLVDDAYYADETNDHTFLGWLLGIPECCREAFASKNETVDFQTDPLLWLTWLGGDFVSSNSSFPNPLARYFSAGLISHYPCSLSCEKSMTLALRNYRYLQQYFPGKAKMLARFENCSGFYIEGWGVALFPFFEWSGNCLRFNFSSAQVQGQKLRILLKNCDSVHLISSSHILLTKGNSILREIYGCEVRAGKFSLPQSY